MPVRRPGPQNGPLLFPPASHFPATQIIVASLMHHITPDLFFPLFNPELFFCPFPLRIRTFGDGVPSTYPFSFLPAFHELPFLFPIHRTFQVSVLRAARQRNVYTPPHLTTQKNRLGFLPPITRRHKHQTCRNFEDTIWPPTPRMPTPCPALCRTLSLNIHPPSRLFHSIAPANPTRARPGLRCSVPLV